MNSYHDYHIHGYEVDSLERRIKIKLAWPEESGSYKIKYVIFNGVYGYELKNDSMASIVFEFEEVALNEFIDEFGEEIGESYRQNGSYGSWAHDMNNAEDELRKNNVKPVILSSSMGMVGWLLTQSIVEENA